MPVPDFQSFMLPMLKYAADGKEHSKRQFIEALAHEFEMTEQDRREMLPSGNQPRFDNRVAWSLTHLKKAGLLVATKRAYARITERGQVVLAEGLEKITVRYLHKFPEYAEFRTALPQEKVDDANSSDESDDLPPEEVIAAAHQRLRDALAAELLQQIKEMSPHFFERLVVDLLVKMGYGGTRQDAGKAIGKSGDEGIDGIIKEDRLGLDVIYLQAKRWEGSVGRPEIQKFVGALHGQRARKGVFITTSSFTQDALAYASAVESKVILIDGDTLAGLMIDHGVGVAPVAAYEIKRIDSDYFTE